MDLSFLQIGDSQHAQRGDGNDERAAAFEIRAFFFHDFIDEIPSEQQIGVRRTDGGLVDDRNPRARNQQAEF